jgi:RNA polymerase sigma-70 factor (ECF subfamily)
VTALRDAFPGAAPSPPRPNGTTRVQTEDLHERYARSIFRYCLRHLRSREEAEDAAQIVFLNAHRSLARGIEPRSEQAWLFKIAEHVVLYRRRTIARRARVEFPVDIDSLADVVEAPGQNGDAALIGLPEALARLPEAERKAIVLREWHGLSYREVAAELEVSASAAEALIFRGRRRLAEVLNGSEPPRKRARLGIFSVLTSLKWLLGGGGASVKTVIGVTSIAVIAAVPVTQVMQSRSKAPPAVRQHRVAAPPSSASDPPRHVAARSVPRAKVRPAKPAPAASPPHLPAPATHAGSGPAAVPAPETAPVSEGPAPVPDVLPVPEAVPAPEPGVADTSDTTVLPSLPPDELVAMVAEPVPAADPPQLPLTAPPDEAAAPVVTPEATVEAQAGDGEGVDVPAPDDVLWHERDPAGLGANETPGVPRRAEGEPLGDAEHDPPGRGANDTPGVPRRSEETTAAPQEEASRSAPSTTGSISPLSSTRSSRFSTPAQSASVA